MARTEKPETRKEAISIAETIRILQDLDQTLTAAVIYSLSDIGANDLNTLKAAWRSIPAERRVLLQVRLGEVSETNFDMNFDAVSRLALADEDEEVRQAAIEALWYDESPDLMRKLMAMAKNDLAEGVRAEALSALGRFILMGELGTLNAALATEVQDTALEIYNDADELVEVRRRAIEALGNCTREGVAELIQEAYESDEQPMRVSAVFAMGCSYDDEWIPTILHELTSDDLEMVYEAVRSAGELQLEEAIPQLAELMSGNDREVLEMAVWSLGEIGGPEARGLLEHAAEQAEILNDEGMIEAIEEALETATLVGENLRFDD